MSASNREEQIRKYYDCYAKKDRASLGDLLVKSFAFQSSHSQFDDRDAMLDAIWPHVEKNQSAVSNLSFFHADKDHVIAKYTVMGPQGGANMCECFHFEGDQISRVEVFMGRAIQVEKSS